MSGRHCPGSGAWSGAQAGRWGPAWMNEPVPGRGGARTGARSLECQICRSLLNRCPACTDCSLSLNGGISLASSKEEWKRFGCFPGRGGKISDLGQAQGSPDSSGVASASPFSLWLWSRLLPPEAAVGWRLFPAISKTAVCSKRETGLLGAKGSLEYSVRP